MRKFITFAMLAGVALALAQTTERINIAPALGVETVSFPLTCGVQCPADPLPRSWCVSRGGDGPEK